ncbi:MAG: glutamine synthetase type [Conexibacter sp.]|nr:glutamine synthetase type [Conexibacter sp.]
MSSTTTKLYPATLEEALPSAERVREVREQLEAAGVEYVLSCWIDILGSPKTKPVPLAEFEELCAGRGPQFAVHSVSMVPELGPADADQIVLPDLDSVLICPWDTTTAFVFGDLFWEDAPYNVCPRFALKRQVQRANEAGYNVNAGFEPEFIVLRKADDGQLVKAFGGGEATASGREIKRQAYGYDVEHSLDGMPFLDQLVTAINGLGWGLSNVVCEGAYSQFELDFGYADVVTSADRFVFLRVMLKEIAKRNGLIVTYMPKPSNGDWRSGAHINYSMTPIDDPRANIFAGEDGAFGPSTFSAVAGLLRHGKAITAVACPTVNSYKGLVGHSTELEGGTETWAPSHICYGYNNRSAMIRLPQRRFAIENRACDMTVNPYLALAMTVGATLEGLQQGLEAPRPVDKPLYALTAEEAKAADVQHLPRTLIEAITAFDEDELAKDVFGPTMHGMYSKYKHMEWTSFHEHVTEWEQIEYLQFF